MTSVEERGRGDGGGAVGESASDEDGHVSSDAESEIGSIATSSPASARSSSSSASARASTPHPQSSRRISPAVAKPERPRPRREKRSPLATTPNPRRDTRASSASSASSFRRARPKPVPQQPQRPARRLMFEARRRKIAELIDLLRKLEVWYERFHDPAFPPRYRQRILQSIVALDTEIKRLARALALQEERYEREIRGEAEALASRKAQLAALPHEKEVYAKMPELLEYFVQEQMQDEAELQRKEDELENS